MRGAGSPRAFALAAFCVALAHGIASADTTVTGTIDNADPTDGLRHETFTCVGTPTCVGTHTVTSQPKVCSNSHTGTANVSFTGFNLSQPGTFSGTEVIPNRLNHTVNADGTCTYTVGPGVTWPFTATWNGTTGTLNITGTHQDGTPRPEQGTFSANVAPPPVFPMTVAASVNTATSNASAQIQPRPQDVGTTQSVFVFAHAPASQVVGATAKRDNPEEGAAEMDDAVVCVLAQVNGQGQLIAVSAATMQAYLTGVLGSQSQAVSILNNVSTPNVAGATFFVGYGPNASGMLANGVYQSAITIPGNVQCNANPASAPAPKTPGAITGLWWNANESGWGIHFTQRGNNVFAAWYTYDSTGKPKWYVSTCSGFTGTSGTCNGTVFEVTGPSFFGGAFNASLVNATGAGTLTLTFSNGTAASMTYSVAGVTRTVALTRQPLGGGTTTPAVDFSDIWWGGPSESGWGMAMAQQSGITFVAWYVYDANGKPTWLVATCIMSGSSCSGTLFRTTGPPFGPTFNPTAVAATAAGTILVAFTDANNAIITYTVDGVSATKAITRQLF